MSAFALAQVESAIRYWLLESTGLIDDEVIWHYQGGPQPASGRFITVRLAGLTPASPLPEAFLRDNPDFEEPAPGELPGDLLHVSRRNYVLNVYVQANSKATSGPSSSFELARKASAGLDLLPVESALRVAGLSVADPGSPRDITTLLDTRFQGRHSLDVRFNASDEVASALPYINQVSGTGTLEGARQTLEVPFSQSLED